MEVANFKTTKKRLSLQSKVKQVVIFVYDKDGIIVTNQVLNGITMIAAYYQKFIHSVLGPQTLKFRAEKTDINVWPLRNNVHPHVAQPAVGLFTDYSWETLCHQPYSPNFDLFSKLFLTNVSTNFIICESTARIVRKSHRIFLGIVNRLHELRSMNRSVKVP